MVLGSLSRRFRSNQQCIYLPKVCCAALVAWRTWKSRPTGMTRYDQKVAETAYWDTLNVQMVDAHTVEIIAKKAGKTMLTEVDAISLDGSTLTQLVKDTTEAETVTIETHNRRIKKGLMALTPFPVHGERTKPIAPGTVR